MISLQGREICAFARILNWDCRTVHERRAYLLELLLDRDISLIELPYLVKVSLVSAEFLSQIKLIALQ